MNTFVLWILFLNPITGDLVDSRPDSEPMSLRECMEESINRGPQVVKNEKVPIFVCHRPEVAEVSI